MHVLIPVLHRPVKPTGVCRHAVNLAQCLADSDRVHRITLVIGQWQEDYFERSFTLDSAKIQLLTVDIKGSSLSRNRWFVLGLPKLARQLQPDIIHMSFPFPFIRQWFKAPVVASIHDLYPYEFPENFGYPQVWFNRGFLNQCIHNSDGLTCVSHVTLKSLNHFFPQEKIKQYRDVVYNYVDFSGIELRVPQALFPAEDLKFLLCVGQHRKNKNLDWLIQAYANLRQAQVLPKTMKLVLVGSLGPKTDYLNDLVESLAIQNNVIFLSALADEELVWLYKHSEVFVMPSSTEGFCLPLVEALFWGCRVVCSQIPIFREVGSDTCTYFELGDTAIANLEAAIVQTLHTEPAESTPVNPNFLKANITQKLMGFYDRLGIP
ncbi:MAG: glycosyltransferase family 1 protein [Cyanobacteria bacterium J06626_18]